MILLISDLHLQAERPELTRAFLSFLQHEAARAQALYILGDFFEAWLGDDAMDDYQTQIAHALRKLTDSGVDVFFMRGNRDFLVGNDFLAKTGCKNLPDPSIVNWFGENVLLMHGDSLCTLDESYMRLRRVLRNPVTLWLLRHSPLKWRLGLARKLRAKSRTQTRMKSRTITDVSPDAVQAIMQQHQVKTLIHGHTHRPAVHDLADHAQRIVLGDWEALGWYLTVTPEGYQLHSFPIEPCA